MQVDVTRVMLVMSNYFKHIQFFNFNFKKNLTYLTRCPMPRRCAIANRFVSYHLARTAVLAKHSSTRMCHISIATLFILTNSIRTHRLLAPIALVMRWTFAHHAVHIVRAFATVLAKIITRIGLTLFAPESLVAFAHWHFQKVQRTISVSTAVTITYALFTAFAREPTGTLALADARCSVQLTDTVRFALKMVAVLTFGTVKSNRTITRLDFTANDSARGSVMAAILKYSFNIKKT